MNTFRLASILLLACSFLACSDEDEDDDFFNDANVVDLTLRDSTIELGEGTILGVEFSFDASRVFDDGDNVVVAIRLPDGVEYREGTAEIDGLSGDESIGAQVTECVSGESFLIFDMDEFDLDTANNPPGDADAVITLTIDGVERVEFETIEAVAGNQRPDFGCGERFDSDEQVGITVR